MEAVAIAVVVTVVVVVAVVIVLEVSRGRRKRAETSRSPLYEEVSKFPQTHTYTKDEMRNKEDKKRGKAKYGMRRTAPRGSRRKAKTKREQLAPFHRCSATTVTIRARPRPTHPPAPTGCKSRVRAAEGDRWHTKVALEFFPSSLRRTMGDIVYEGTVALFPRKS